MRARSFRGLENARRAPPEDVEKLSCGVTNNRDRKKLLPGLDRFPNLRSLSVSGHHLETLPRLAAPGKVVDLDLRECLPLRSLEGIEAFTALEDLDLSGCRNLPWPDSAKRLASLPALTRIGIGGLAMVRLPDGFEELQGLLAIRIGACPDLDFDDALPRLATLSGLRSLTIQVSGRTALPDAFGDFRELRELDIGHGLRALPPSIGRVAALEILDAVGNDLPGLPPEVGALARLRVLSLDGAVASLPPEIGDLKSLEELRLSSARKLKTLPDEIGALSNLRLLDIGFSGVKTLPDSIVNLTNLRVLRGWQLKKLPEGFERLSFDECQLNEKLKPRARLRPPQTELVEDLRLERDGPALPAELGDPRTLVIWMPSLREAPVGFGALRRLEELTLTAGEIDLADALRRLAGARSLQTFHLSLKHGLGLPAEIGGLESLEVLYVSCPKLGALPPEIGRLRRLRRLAIANSALSSLPEELGELESLEVLSIGSCLISSLPESFGKLAALEHLSLDGTKIERLPSSFAGLASLRELRIWGGVLAEVPGALRDLPALEKLTIGYNRVPLDAAALFRTLAGKPLRELAFRSAGIRVLPPEVGELKVETLDLGANPLSAIPPEIGKISTLKTIRLDRWQPGGFKELLPKGRWRKTERANGLTYERTG